MACILLTDMDPPTTSPTALHNGLLPSHEPVPAMEPKEEASVTCLTVHLYHQVKDGNGCGSEGTLSFPAGQYVAEELCVSAAKACGEFQDIRFLICARFSRSSLTKQAGNLSLLFGHLTSLECSAGKLVSAFHSKPDD